MTCCGAVPPPAPDLPDDPESMLSNLLNFSGGPGALPTSVLEQTQRAISALPDTGLSILGTSHRSDWFKALLQEAQDNIRRLLDVPDRYHILFLQGGSSLQFSMIPMNFASAAMAPAEFIASGYWSRKAIGEAGAVVSARTVWDGEADGYRRLPAWPSLQRSGQAPFFHYISNETVEGLQFTGAPESIGVPLIADMSSDFLSRRFDIGDYAMIYAHAQKNLGPAGVTLVLIDDAMLSRIPGGLPPMLDYRTHVEHGSNYNTPPVFSIYVLNLVSRWLRDEIGGVDAMERVNLRKAAILYQALERQPEMIEIHADPESRSTMNVAFRFRQPQWHGQFLAQAGEAGLSGLEGHRSIGGLRASLYNAVSESAVQQLADLIDDFARRHG